MAAGVNETHVSCAEHNFVYKKIFSVRSFIQIRSAFDFFIDVFLKKYFCATPCHTRLHTYNTCHKRDDSFLWQFLAEKLFFLV
jgi:hypothetical protein